MLNLLLPALADNRYRGFKSALWIFGFVVLWKAAVAFGVMFNGHTAAVNADGIALDSFSPAGAQAYLASDAAWGLGSAMLCLISAIALVRYRSLVPLLFAVLLLEHILRRVIFRVMPIAHVAGAAPGGVINLVLTVLLVTGLLLSVLPARTLSSAPADG